MFLLAATLLSFGEKISCFTPPEPIILRLLDKQGNDLLNPATHGFYKSTDVSIYYTENGEKKQTDILIEQIPNTSTYVIKTQIAWIADNGRSFFVKLSDTVTDNLYLKNDKVSENKCSFYRFVELKYNGLLYNKKRYLWKYFRDY